MCDKIDEIRIKNEVMDSRKWIEFGKMFNAFINEGWDVELCSMETAIRPMYSVILFSTNEDEVCSDWHLTPYAAMKEVYFEYLLEMTDVEDVDLELDDDIRAFMEKDADARGITIDEVIIEALKKVIAEKDSETQKECGCNCVGCY